MKQNLLVLWGLVLAALILASVGNTPPVVAQSTETPIPVDQLTVTETDPLDIPNGSGAFLSPDGKEIVWVSGKDLCFYSVAGEKQGCTTLKNSVNPNSIRWSPDSTRITFTENSIYYLVDSDIWVMDVATCKATDLTEDNIDEIKGSDLIKVRSIDMVPTWTSDGKRLIFLRYDGSNKQSVGVFSIDASGGEPKQEGSLNRDGFMVFALDLSPDGKRIAYNSMGSDRNDPQSGLWIANLDGSNLHQLLKGPGKGADPASQLKVILPTDIQFSGDGKYVLAYDFFTAHIHIVPQATTSHVVAIDGSGELPVNAADDVKYATYGPDRTSILYIYLDDKNPDKEGLYVVARPGDPGHRIYQGALMPSTPGWRTLFWAANNTVLVLIVQRTGPNAGERYWALMHLGVK